MDIHKIQSKLHEEQLDGWLIYDYHGSNNFAKELLKIPEHGVFTRRLFYWIPQKGEPHKVVHYIESDCLDHLEGKKEVYLSWNELEKIIASFLKKHRKIAMEYSPRCAIPNISLVDGGTIDLIRACGAEVYSSANLLQSFFLPLDEKAVETHFAAMEILKKTTANTWDLIAHHLRKGIKLTEYDVQQFILSEFTASDYITEDGPICAVNENSALPHYVATKKNAKSIQMGDFILIDLWCKQNVANAIYADITRVAIAAPEPTPKHQEIFEIVREAQVRTIRFIEQRLNEKNPICGWEVDVQCRDYIEKRGFGKFFPHRTGHSIDTNVHGSGVNLDNFETCDTRLLNPGSCFSIEPGIYLPDEFGIRLECNGLITLQNQLQISGDSQESIFCLL